MMFSSFFFIFQLSLYSSVFETLSPHATIYQPISKYAYEKKKKPDRIPSFHKNTPAVDKLMHFIEWVKDLKYIPLFI